MYMQELSGIKAQLNLVQSRSCGDCVEQCQTLNKANDEGLLCLRAVADARNGEVSAIDDTTLWALIKEPPSRVSARAEALRFIFRDYDERHPTRFGSGVVVSPIILHDD